MVSCRVRDSGSGLCGAGAESLSWRSNAAAPTNRLKQTASLTEPDSPSNRMRRNAAAKQAVAEPSVLTEPNSSAQSGAFSAFPEVESAVPALRSVEVHFNQGVTGVAAEDLLINNVPATNVTAYASWQYVFDFPEPPMGGVQVSWATNANFTSLAGQTNVSPGAGWSYR